GVTREQFEPALAAGTTEELLHHFEPKVGDCLFLPAGIVHAIGGGLMVFEVQQTSDITFRLHDWGRVDPKTGRPRELHVEQALACIDWSRGPVSPAVPADEATGRERLVDCPHFRLWRPRGGRPFPVRADDECRIIVTVEGHG